MLSIYLFIIAAFVAEGRKVIEHFLKKGVNPQKLVLGQDESSKLSEALYTVEELQEAVISSLESTITHNPAMRRRDKLRYLAAVPSIPKEEKAQAHIQRKRELWSRIMSNKDYVPPALTDSLSNMDPATKRLWRRFLIQAVSTSSKNLQRMSQAVSASGFVCSLPFLPNISIIKDSCGVNSFLSSDAPLECDDVIPKPNDLDTLWSAQHPTFTEEERARYVPKNRSQHPLNSPFNIHDTFRPYVSPIPADGSGATSADWDWTKGGLVLAGVRDPGNTGTLIRSAAAFGVRQVLILDGCDVYSHKVVQSSSGAIADCQIVCCSLRDFLSYFSLCSQENQASIATAAEENDPFSDLRGVEPYLASMVISGGLSLEHMPTTLEEVMMISILGQDHEDGSIQTVELNSDVQELLRQSGRRPWLIVGSEAHGIPADLQAVSHINATIPMPGAAKNDTPNSMIIINNDDGVGSLNAGVAGSLACFLLQNKFK